MSGRCCCRCGRIFHQECIRGPDVEIARFADRHGRPTVRRAACCVDCHAEPAPTPVLRALRELLS